MKYVILIHSNPDPWGHPTVDYTAEGRAIPPEQRERSNQQFEALLTELSASGELVSGEALGDPASATLFRSGPSGYLATEGPYAESKEHLAGFFIIDCDSRDRAEEITAQFAGPGDVVELRPAMWPGADDQ